MEMQNELQRWKDRFRKANTPEEKMEHKRLFNEFLNSLEPTEGKAFARAFLQGTKESKERLDKVTQALQLKKDLEVISDFTSMSYIAKHYFGKTRHWLYQRINGSIVNGKPVALTNEEKQKLATALKDLGTVMNKTALTLEQGIKL